MDKRTVEGKKFNSLKSTEEKTLFLLEGIYDKLESVHRLEWKLNRLSDHLKFISELTIQELDLQNKNKIWTDEYIKQLKKRHSYL